MIRRLLIVVAALAGLSLPASAQAVNIYCWNPAGSGLTQWLPCGTSGTGIGQITGTTTQTKVTVSVTNTYVNALAANANRKGCTIQYIAVAGAKGFVFFGAAPADTTTSFQLTNGQTINCGADGVTLTDAVQVTGTGTDIFVVSSQ